MRIAMSLLALSLTISVAACKKKKTEEAGPGTGTAMAGTGEGTDMGTGMGTGEGTGMAGTGEGTGAGPDDKMAKKAGNCPSTVLKSTTKAEVKGKDIALTITSDDKDAIATIQRRAEELLKEKADSGGGTGGGGGTHDQKGSYGGAMGICPVYWTEGGKATSKKTAKGVVITITPKEKPEELKATIDERIAKAAEWVTANVKDGEEGNTGGVGGGKGDHGGNHSGQGDGKGKERAGAGAGTGAQ